MKWKRYLKNTIEIESELMRNVKCWGCYTFNQYRNRDWVILILWISSKIRKPKIS